MSLCHQVAAASLYLPYHEQLRSIARQLIPTIFIPRPVELLATIGLPLAC